MLEWLSTTTVALAVRDSLPLTAVLSAVHLLGFTLITGAALVSNLRMLGVLLREHSVITIARPAARGVALGLGISVVTGSLLFAPRALDASVNSTFRLKMLLLVSAASFQLVVHRWVCRHVVNPTVLRLTGATALLLWLGVGAAGAAYILLE